MLQYVTWNVNPEIFRIGPFNLPSYIVLLIIISIGILDFVIKLRKKEKKLFDNNTLYLAVGVIIFIILRSNNILQENIKIDNGVRWYGLLWALGIFSALIIVQKLYKHEKLPEKWMDKQFFYVLIGTILGARLGHCLFYEWTIAAEPFTVLGITFKYENYYISHPWQIFNVFNGGLAGLASHGGVIGIVIAMYLYDKKVTHKGFLWGMDRLVIGAVITGAAIRLGNLMNSEIYGSATTLAWGFNFPQDAQWDQKAHHPTQIYEMIYCLVAFAVLWYMYWKKQSFKKTGLLFGTALFIVFGARFLLEFIKLDQVAIENGMFLNIGQKLSIPFIIWGIWLMIRSKNQPEIEEEITAPIQEVKKVQKKKK